MPRPPLPSGAQMWNKSKIVKENAKILLERKPTSRGSQWIALIYYLHYFISNKLIHVHFGPGITIKIKSWDALFLVPSPETVRRRIQEWQNAKNPDDSYKHPNLRPSNRTEIKRAVREEAIRNYFGKGYSLADHIPIGIVKE